MARKRLISPEFFMHEALFEAEARTGLPLRVAFAGLWTQADRRGVFRWRAKQLKLAILPYDPVDFEEVLNGLRSAGLIERYEIAGDVYGFIPKFTRWQTFHHAERDSDAPGPETNLGLVQHKPRSNPTVAVAVAVAVPGSVTNAVAVDRSAGPEGPPPPVQTAKGYIPWREEIVARGAAPIGFVVPSAPEVAS